MDGNFCRYRGIQKECFCNDKELCNGKEHLKMNLSFKYFILYMVLTKEILIKVTFLFCSFKKVTLLRIA